MKAAKRFKFPILGLSCRVNLLSDSPFGESITIWHKSLFVPSDVKEVRDAIFERNTPTPSVKPKLYLLTISHNRIHMSNRFTPLMSYSSTFGNPTGSFTAKFSNKVPPKQSFSTLNVHNYLPRRALLSNERDFDAKTIVRKRLISCCPINQMKFMWLVIIFPQKTFSK